MTTVTTGTTPDTPLLWLHVANTPADLLVRYAELVERTEAEADKSPEDYDSDPARELHALLVRMGEEGARLRRERDMVVASLGRAVESTSQE